MPDNCTSFSPFGRLWRPFLLHRKVLWTLLCNKKALRAGPHCGGVENVAKAPRRASDL